MKEKLTVQQRNVKGAARNRELAAERKLAYEADPVLCKHCTSPLPYGKQRNVFCGKSCSAAFNNVGIVHNSGGVNSVQNRRTKRPCANCTTDTFNVRFCNMGCLKEHRRKERENHIAETGKLTGNAKTIKQYITARQGHNCQICGLTEWRGQPAPLVCDHINGDSTDNRPDNLRLLCHNCNAQTETFAGRNPKGSGRFYRRQRYHDGKSW
jgi:hypothetical protein